MLVARCETRDAGGAHAPSAQSPRPTVRAILPPTSYPTTAPSRRHHALRPSANACHPESPSPGPAPPAATRRRTRGAGWPGAVAWWHSGSVSAADWGRLAWVWRPPASARTHRTAAQGHPARLTRGASAQISWPPCHRERGDRPCRSAGHGGRHNPRRCTAAHRGLVPPPSRWLQTCLSAECRRGEGAEGCW